MNAKLIEQEIFNRELQRRFETAQEEITSLNNDLKSVEAKNIELSRQRTAAESEAKALTKQLSAEKEARAKDTKELTRQVKSLTESNTTIEKNMRAVATSKDESYESLKRELKRAEKALADHKKESKEVVVELSKTQKEVIEARTGRVVPDGFTMTKQSEREIDVTFRYGPEVEVIPEATATFE